MIKLTTKQIGEAQTLANTIYECEAAKDSPSGENVKFSVSTFHKSAGLGGSMDWNSYGMPIERSVLIDAANRQIADCHEKLKAMGIELAPSPDRQVGKVLWESEKLTPQRFGPENDAVIEQSISQGLAVGDRLWIGGKRVI